MVEKAAGIKTIWFFVGIVLLVMGGLIFLSGIINWIQPPAKKTVLFELHPALWWGGLMMVIGLIYLLTNKNKVVEQDDQALWTLFQKELRKNSISYLERHRSSSGRQAG